MTNGPTECELRSDYRHAEQLIEIAQTIGIELTAIDLDQPNVGLNLAGGVAGYSLLSACLARVSDPGNRFSEFAHRCLQKIAADLPRTEPVYPGLFTGLSGIAWATRYVSDLLEVSDQRPPDADDAVYDFIEGYLDIDTEFEYDLISGLSGIGIWALTTPEQTRRSRIVSRILDLLERSSESTEDGGLTWRTPSVRARRFGHVNPGPGPEYNLGLAHGVPGVIGLLALCIERRVEQDRAEEIIRKTIRWLQPQVREGLSAFPNTTGSSAHSRAAWCYGDPGVALVLHRAAYVLHSHELQTLARQITARFCLRRQHDSSVNDASLCHGSAGLVLICQRLQFYDPSDAIEAARRYWLDVLLAKRSADGACGFPYWNGLSRRYERSFSFLNGAAGVGLTLLSEAGLGSQWGFPALLG